MQGIRVQGCEEPFAEATIKDKIGSKGPKPYTPRKSDNSSQLKHPNPFHCEANTATRKVDLSGFSGLSGDMWLKGPHRHSSWVLPCKGKVPQRLYDRV